jgi:hypothetical protein
MGKMQAASGMGVLAVGCGFRVKKLQAGSFELQAREKLVVGGGKNLWVSGL